MSEIRTVCSSAMPYAVEAFSTIGSVESCDAVDVTRDVVRDADVLAVRSTIKVDSGLLDGTSVKFVGTATIGTDHMDLDYLDARGISWCYAPGCNANSVAEYVVSSLLCLVDRREIVIALVRKWCVRYEVTTKGLHSCACRSV